jgi:hypothetical protein
VEVSSNTPSWRGAKLKHRNSFAFFTFIQIYSIAATPDCSVYYFFVYVTNPSQLQKLYDWGTGIEKEAMEL